MSETEVAARDAQLVVFTLAGDEYALPIEQVQEVIRYSEPRRVTSDQPWVAGVISLRGKIIPVCDLALRLGQGAHPRSDAKIVIVELAAGTAGVIVDEVNEVHSVSADQFDAVPTGGGYIKTLAKLDGRLVAVFDSAALLDGVLDS